MGIVNRDSIKVMEERGIDISGNISDQLTDELIKWADVVVTLGCCTAEQICPLSFKGKTYDWDIKDPLGKSWEVMREVRDDI